MRQMEMDKNKRFKMNIQPGKIMVEFTGYQPKEIGMAIGSMGSFPAFPAAIGTSMQGKALTNK